jgi:ribosome-binding factor A
MLQRDIADPRLALVTITGVDVDRELSFATIHVSALDGSARSAEILQALERAKGFLRHELAARISLRTFPQLRFAWDATAERAARIEELLAGIRQAGGPEKKEDAGR